MARSTTKENRKEAQERASSSTKKKKREEEPASEVETILLEKLKSGIDSNPPWRSLFDRCKSLLDTKLKPSMERTARIRFRRRVHLLNNLMAKHHSALARIDVFFACQLKQIMNDIAADPTEQQQPGGEKRLIEDQTERVPSRATPVEVEPPGFFEEDLMAAENLMLCRDFSPTELRMAGIYGPEGVGKTTLAQLVFHSDKARSMFLPRIWICLEKDDAKESAEAFLTRRILVELGFDRESASSAGRSEIKSALLEKRYIIVLDGASEETREWNKELMEVLRETLPKGTGGVVVVTGRAEEAVKEMVGGGGLLHRLLPLDKPVKCWKVYTVAAEEQGKEEALNECMREMKRKKKEREEKKKAEMAEEEEEKKKKNAEMEEKRKADSDEEMEAELEEEKKRKAELEEEEEKRKADLELEEKTKKDLDEIHKVKNEVVKRSDGLPWASTLLGILRREIKASPPELEETKKELEDEIHKVKNEVVKRSDGLPWASTLPGILRRKIKTKPSPSQP